LIENVLKFDLDVLSKSELLANALNITPSGVFLPTKIPIDQQPVTIVLPVRKSKTDVPPIPITITSKKSKAQVPTIPEAAGGATPPIKTGGGSKDPPPGKTDAAAAGGDPPDDGSDSDSSDESFKTTDASDANYHTPDSRGKMNPREATFDLARPIITPPALRLP
jgi:hypothetical protein